MTLSLLPAPHRRTPGAENCYRLQIAALTGRFDYVEIRPWVFAVWAHATPDRRVVFVPTTGRVQGTTQRGWAALCAQLGVTVR